MVNCIKSSLNCKLWASNKKIYVLIIDLERHIRKLTVRELPSRCKYSSMLALIVFLVCGGEEHHVEEGADALRYDGPPKFKRPEILENFKFVD